MTIPTQLFVNGAWRPSSSGVTKPLINPATEETFAEVESADLQDVEAAVESAHRAWETGWRDLAPGKRSEVLFNVARLLREDIEQIAQLESRNIGKPIADARDEVALGARVFEYYAGALTDFLERRFQWRAGDSTSPCGSRWGWWRRLCRGIFRFP